MRADMFKVIVERPRRKRPGSAGSDYPRGHLENRWAPDWEAAPRTEGMGTGYGEKGLNENLQPLVRFLRSNAGRPWDAVYSEIAAHLSCRSAVQKHVLDHLRQYVREDVLMDGETVLAKEWRRFEPLVSVGMRFRFYVCPRTRLLRLAPQRPRKRKRKGAEPQDRVVLSDERELRRIDGIWYEIAVSPIPTDRACFDVIERAAPDLSRAWTVRSPLWRSGRYARSKLQLNSRELVRYRLVPLRAQ